MRRLVLFALFAACGGKVVGVAEPRKMMHLLPATLEAARPRTGDARTVHVRVWVDAAVRATPHWKEDIADQIDYASQLLQPLVGAKLQVDKIDEWNRSGAPGAALDELVALDDAKNAAFVIGYVAPPDTATKAMTELVQARVLDRRVVVRGWPEPQEVAALAGRIPDVKDAQRAEVVAAHRRHKMTVALLHALAASCAAIDEADPTWIQHPLYSPKQSTFSDRDRELIQIGFDGVLGESPTPTIAHDLLAAIEKSEWGGWIPTSHDEVVAALRNIVDQAKKGKTAADVPAAAFEQYERASTLAKRGENEQALVELDNLLTAYPGNAAMHQLKCEIMIGKPGLADAKTKAACARAVEVAPGDPAPHFLVGEALARAGDVAKARAELVLAEQKIANLKDGVEAAWKKLVALYAGMGALTWTEQAAAAGKLDNDPLLADIARTRARYGVPRGGKVVAPDKEPELVAAVRGAIALVDANKFGEAAKVLAAAERKFSGAPGLVTARCDLALRQNQVPAARAACARALAKQPDESFALYLSAIIALRDTGAAGTKSGIDQLKRAIAADPDLGQAWRALAKAYARAKDDAALADLRAQYQAKFGQPLQ
jgi:predicted Zn-dependent protease